MGNGELELKMQSLLTEAIRTGRQMQANVKKMAEPAPGEPSRELALAVTNAEQGLHWLGADMAKKGIE